VRVAADVGNNPSRTEASMLSVDRLALRTAGAAVGPVFYLASSNLGTILLLLLLLMLIATLIGFGVRFIPNDRVGIIEKLWSLRGSVNEGRIMAFNGQAGYEAQLLRGGIHFGKWVWQYRIHKVPLVTIPQGKVGYVYARDGEPLTPGQTLGRVVECANFQDARMFLSRTPLPKSRAEAPPDAGSEQREEPDVFVTGQRGRQRAILREGVYAINLALFVVITEDRVYHLNVDGKHELQKLVGWQEELRKINGFNPVVIGEQMSAIDPLNPDKMIAVDSIGIVTIHDGPSLAPGEIIAPSVGNDPVEQHYHNNYQDAESFIRAGGRRGRQYVPLTDGTYFINRWFATVELIPKTVVPIGHVGVVVSYYGPMGKDLSGDSFRHGERVARGERGVWERPMGPGKYPFNTYAGLMVLVPTTNFVLHWVTGRTEAHRYDDTLKSIEMVTRDAYEPTLPLSVVVHIDYMKAPSVIQRFGDVKKLITQTLDPMLSAFFRDVAHKRTMLELLQQRDNIQLEARKELQRRFFEFDIECVDVLIGKPDTQEAGGKIETLLEQLRQRQLSVEQIETYQKQRAAAEEQKKLNEAQAVAARQTELTGSKVQIDIARNQADADLERARKHAEQTIVTAEAESKQRILAGQGEARKIAEIGQAEAEVLTRKIASFADPRLYALSVVAEHLSHSTQPLVPQQVFMSGGSSGGGKHAASLGMVSTLVDLMVAEKSGFRMPNNGSAKVIAHPQEEAMETARAS
jgi:uncharacterized membrane protein YqiK